MAKPENKAEKAEKAPKVEKRADERGIRFDVKKPVDRTVKFG